MNVSVSELRNELESGEQLLWNGQPRQGIFLRGSDLFLIPFSLFWGGFAIFWESMAVGSLFFKHSEKLPFMFALLFPLFGIPFVLVGLYLIFGRFLVDMLQRKRTFYGVTDRRIIIRSGLFSLRLKSLNLRTLSDLSLSERSNGTGTISFGPTSPFGNWMGGSGSAWPGTGRYSPPCFDSISDVKRVYNIVREAQKAAT